MLAHARHSGRILGPGLIRIYRLGATQGRPAFGEDDVLDQRGHAIYRALRLALLPPRLTGAGLFERPFTIDQHEGVGQAVLVFDAGERRFGNLDRREVAGRIAVEQLQSRHPYEILRHGSSALP